MPLHQNAPPSTTTRPCARAEHIAWSGSSGRSGSRQRRRHSPPRADAWRLLLTLRPRWPSRPAVPPPPAPPHQFLGEPRVQLEREGEIGERRQHEDHHLPRVLRRRAHDEPRRRPSHRLALRQQQAQAQVPPSAAAAAAAAAAPAPAPAAAVAAAAAAAGAPAASATPRPASYQQRGAAAKGAHLCRRRVGVAGAVAAVHKVAFCRYCSLF